MLTPTQRERILSHLRRGWKLPDSLVQELWEAYETLARAYEGKEGGPIRAPEARPTPTDLKAHAHHPNGTYDSHN